MPLYQQGGLTSSKGGLQGIDKVVEGFLRARALAQQQEQLDMQKILFPLEQQYKKTQLEQQQELFPIEKAYKEAQIQKLSQPQASDYQLTKIIDPETKQPVVASAYKMGGREPIVIGQAPPPVSPATVNINTGTSPLEKSTKGAVERKIEEIDTMLTNIKGINKITKDSFLTYGGQVKAGLSRFGEKITGEKNIGSDYLAQYGAWKMLSQEQYLQKRHQITGVASNPTEQVDIAKAIPDPNKDSFSLFRSKMKALEVLLNAHRTRLVNLRAAGIENPTPEQLEQLSAESPITMESVGIDPNTLETKTQNTPETLEDIDNELAEIDRRLGLR